jgi:hypothetical protein
MKVSPREAQRLQEVLAELKLSRTPFWHLWREVADYFLPKRYVWLESGDENRRTQNAKNPHILDSTGTLALRTLASGMMNGITSPSRPWFKLKIRGFEAVSNDVARWQDEVGRRMLAVMAESNFYSSMATLYLDLCGFGSAASLIYEDDDNVIHCYNPALGEFYFGQSHRLAVDTFGREIQLSAKQLVQQFGKENCSEEVQNAVNAGGAQALKLHRVTHLIEPRQESSSIARGFTFQETYWESASLPKGVALAQRGYNELPGIFPRWEVTANDSYGTSPAMDALADVIQLQLETKRKAQGIDKVVNPPIVADIQLQHRPMALLPNGITYVSGQNNVGAKPLYQIQPPLQEMTEDIMQVQMRIRETLHNDLFRMISQLDTVRSATEIDARREEKLVLLGSVLDRFEKEALSPAINRVFSIMERRGLLPEPPPELEDGVPIEIEYVSILSTAQRAVSAAPTERWLQLIGNLIQVAPQVGKVPDWDNLIRNYGEAIGVEARDMKSREQVAAEDAAAAQAAQAEQAMQAVQVGATAAQQLSDTDVGGGSNALQQLLAQS